MKRFFLLTAFGKDRPGIVAGVTRALFDAGANIADASMTRLGGEFAMMLIASVPGAAVLAKGLKALEKKFGLQTALKPIPAGAVQRAKEAQPRYLISVYGTDHPGIVYPVAAALARRGANITDLQTKTLPGRPPAYVMLIEIQIPPALDSDELRGDLDRLRQDLKVEISLQDIDAVAL